MLTPGNAHAAVASSAQSPSPPHPAGASQPSKRVVLSTSWQDADHLSDNFFLYSDNAAADNRTDETGSAAMMMPATTAWEQQSSNIVSCVSAEMLMQTFGLDSRGLAALEDWTRPPVGLPSRSIPSVGRTTEDSVAVAAAASAPLWWLSHVPIKYRQSSSEFVNAGSLLSLTPAANTPCVAAPTAQRHPALAIPSPKLPDRQQHQQQQQQAPQRGEELPAASFFVPADSAEAVLKYNDPQGPEQRSKWIKKDSLACQSRPTAEPKTIYNPTLVHEFERLEKISCLVPYRSEEQTYRCRQYAHPPDRLRPRRTCDGMLRSPLRNHPEVQAGRATPTTCVPELI